MPLRKKMNISLLTRHFCRVFFFALCTDCSLYGVTLTISLDGKTIFREISEIIGVSTSRVQQINHKSLRELRKNRKLRERELSYGKAQAELYKVEQQYIRNSTITPPNLKAMALLSVHP